MSADTDRFYQLLNEGIAQRRAAAGLPALVRVQVPALESGAAARALGARQQVGLDGETPIAHPSADELRAMLGWPSSVQVGELATWNYLWSDPIQAAVDIRSSRTGNLFGLFNTEPHRTILLEPFWTHWGVGIHREFRPGDDTSNPLFERWYFIILLSNGVPPPPPPPPYSGFGTTVGLPKVIRFSGTVTGRRFAQDGTELATKPATWTRASSATAGRRAVIPGQPGVWLYMVSGAYAGWWVPEGTVEAGKD